MTVTKEREVEPTTNPKIANLQEHFTVLVRHSTENEFQDSINSIERILSAPDYLQILSAPEMKPFYMIGLDPTAPNAVRKLTLFQLTRLADSSHFALLDDLQMNQLIFLAVESDDVGVSGQATQLLVKLSKTNHGLEIALRPEIVTGIQSILQNSKTTDIMKFRVYDMVANVASQNITNFQFCEKLGFLDEIVKTFKTEDLLQKLNVLELLDKLMSLREGTIYLSHNKLFEQLAEILRSEDPMATFLQPRIIRLFASLSIKGDTEIEIIEKSKVIDPFSSLLTNGTYEVKDAVITALGYLGSTPRGLKLLETNKIFLEFVSCIHREDDLRVIALHSIGHLLSHLAKREISSQEDVKVQTVMMNVPSRNSHDTKTMVEWIMPLLKTPFPDVRYAAYDVMNGLAHYRWGVQSLLNFPGFFEFVMNRATEGEKLGKEWKFTVIQTMVGTLTKNSGLIDSTRLRELQLYLKQGVFYVKAENKLEIAEEAVQ